MKSILLFIVLSIPIVIISWRTLFDTKSHGFYRFFGWECIVWLFVRNYRYWFTDPFSFKQLISWILLIVCTYLVIAGLSVFKRTGKIEASREDKNLFGFEKTTELIDTGVYAHIRHPLYGSLILLTWGIFFKHPTLGLLIVSAASTLFLYITSRNDEKECIAYFGDKYRQYMKRSKMFLPWIF